MSFSDMDLDVEEFDSELETGYTATAEGVEAEFPEIDFEALGIDPGEPTLAKPGSEEKVCMLSARYAAGLPLWHDSDCIDHGPAGDLD